MKALVESIARIADLARDGDVTAVHAELEHLQRAAKERREAMARARHDMGNVLSIAQASVEAMLDGVAPVTDARLKRVCELLQSASVSLYRLTTDED